MTLYLLDSFSILIANLYKAATKIDYLKDREHIVEHVPLFFNGILCLVDIASLSLSTHFRNFSYNFLQKNIDSLMLFMKFVTIERRESD